MLRVAIICSAFDCNPTALSVCGSIKPTFQTIGIFDYFMPINIYASFRSSEPLWIPLDSDPFYWPVMSVLLISCYVCINYVSKYANLYGSESWLCGAAAIDTKERGKERKKSQKFSIDRHFGNRFSISGEDIFWKINTKGVWFQIKSNNYVRHFSSTTTMMPQ